MTPPIAVDEPDLVRAAQAGDRRALDQLLRDNQQRIHAICRRITGNDTLVFELEVTPEGASAPITASFRQDFFAQ